MADEVALLVPISLQALLINNDVLSQVAFERWTNNYSNLNTFQDPVPGAFTNIGQNPAPGVHLHWRLPQALTHGEAPAGSTSAAFPATPNRWVVVRLATTAGSAVPPALTAWVIQSDYLGDDGSSPFADPSQVGQAPNIRLTMLGKSWEISQWEGEPGGSLFLTATGLADVMFTAFQPGLVDVYAFHDDVTGLAEQTLLTYLVAGWYSDPTQDPLATSTPAALNWTILGSAPPPSPPTVSVFHGLVYGLTWQTATAPPRVDADASSMQVAVGYTTIDALAAVLATRAGQPPGSTLEMQLQAFLYNALGTLDARDGQAQLELTIRRAAFGSVPGGTTWDIVPVAQGQQDQAPLARAVVPPPAELTPPQAAWLAALNTRQRKLDATARELVTMQQELFAVWWKSQYGPINQKILEQPPNSIDMDYILGQVTAALVTASDSFLSQVQQKQQAVAAQQAALPIPSSPASIAAFSAQIPGNGAGTLTLKPRAMPPFCPPNDPVVLVAGFTAPAGPDPDQPLPCRLVDAAVTGVRVAGGTPATVTASSLPSGTIPMPAFRSGVLLPDPAITVAIAALAVEAFFVDPNNAQAIVARGGVTPNDATVVGALGQAMAAGTAQISSVAQPLEASFAFAAWQQAWAPLFLEWEITWFPSVTAQPTGPPEPGGDENQNYNPAQDNFPFDPTNWAFDGSDGVAQRGSEYDSWKGGNIWGTTGSSLVPSSAYTGRTFLTPHATTLLAGRLKGLAIWLASSSPLTPAQIQALIQYLGQTQFLSQAMSGFNDAFLTWSLRHTPPPPPGSAVAQAIGDQHRGVPAPDVGNQDYSFSATGTPFFFPLRGGFFQFERLNIVDGFGQVLDLLAANGNPVRGGTDEQMAASFAPIRAAGLVPEFSDGGQLPGMTLARLLNQAPRVVQPSRLNLRLLDATDDTREVDLAAGANPVGGWLLPNLLDHSLAVYDATGAPLGELLVLADGSGHQDVTWLPAPASPYPVADPSQIANPHLNALVGAFTAPGGGIPADERVAAFQAFFWAIDEALWTIDPRGGGGPDLVALIGRPLALVRARVQFELFGRPAYNQSWRDTLQSQESGFTSPTLTFPIKLGSVELLDDGLAGYYAGDTYTTFYAVSPSQQYAAPYVTPIVPDGNIALPFNYPNYSTQALSLLIDPRGSVHATTGLLPTLEVKIPRRFVDGPLARIAVTFRIGPVLTGPEAVRIPFPAERKGVWSWITRSGTGDQWSIAPIVAATARARLDSRPPRLIDGWLKFAPAQGRGAAPLLTVGTGPVAVAVTPDGAYAFVANAGDDTVSVIDAEGLELVGPPIPVGRNPEAIAVTPDNTRVFIACGGDNTVWVLDVQSLRVVGAPISVGKGPQAVAVTPDGAHAFVVNAADNTVTVLEVESLQVVGTPIEVGNSPQAVAVTPDGLHAFVTNGVDNTITVLDAQTFAVVGAPVPAGTGPGRLAISPDGTYVFVAGSGQRVTVLDAQTFTVVGTPIPVGHGAAGITVTPDGTRVLVANTADNKVTAIDAQQFVVVGTPIPVGNGPSGVAVTPDGSIVLVTNAGDGTVTVLASSAALGTGARLRPAPRSEPPRW